MRRWQRQALLITAGLVLYLLASAVLYDVAMERLERKPRTFLQSLLWASETMTTTGFGMDHDWSHPLTATLVMVVQWSGVLLVIIFTPLVLLPILERRFEEKLPRTAPRNLRDHVVIFRYGPAVESLLRRLMEKQEPVLVVERNEPVARRLADRGAPVVLVREDDDVLAASGIDRARAFVANGRDEENAAVILRSRRSGFDGAVFALVE